MKMRLLSGQKGVLLQTDFGMGGRQRQGRYTNRKIWFTTHSGRVLPEERGAAFALSCTSTRPPTKMDMAPGVLVTVGLHRRTRGPWLARHSNRRRFRRTAALASSRLSSSVASLCNQHSVMKRVVSRFIRPSMDGVEDEASAVIRSWRLPTCEANVLYRAR